MKYLILGADGQLGTELQHQLDRMRRGGADLEYAATDYERCDITDEAALSAFFSEHPQADTVFNAAAYTAVDDAESQPDRAMEVNALGAGHVAAKCREVGADLVHFSTDFVFGNGHREPVDETVEPEPLSVYGSTKLAGERLALQNHPATVVLRSSGLYSRWGGNFVASIAKYGRQKEQLEVVNDQWVGPTPVTSLARVALEVAEAPVFTGGVYHASVHGECTWYEFAAEIVETLGLGADVEPTTAREYGTEATRPGYAVLDNRRLRLRGLDDFDAWDVELRRFLEQFGDELPSS